MARSPRRIFLALSGASGAVYGLRLLEELLRRPELEVHFTFSATAAEVLRQETGLAPDPDRFEARALGLPRTPRLVYHRAGDLSAPPASGSFHLSAMAVCPCSLGCAARIAGGNSGDLIERAADVMLKERRPLILVPRETPFSAIHLENLLALARAGAVVLPACPGFYGRPQSVLELVDFVVARVLDHLGLPQRLGPRWNGPAPARRRGS